jgi:hypothetical protein
MIRICALMDEAAVEETSGRSGSLTGEFEEHTAANVAIAGKAPRKRA